MGVGVGAGGGGGGGGGGEVYIAPAAFWRSAKQLRLQAYLD